MDIDAYRSSKGLLKGRFNECREEASDAGKQADTAHKEEEAGFVGASHSICFTENTNIADHEHANTLFVSVVVPAIGVDAVVVCLWVGAKKSPPINRRALNKYGSYLLSRIVVQYHGP